MIYTLLYAVLLGRIFFLCLQRNQKTNVMRIYIHSLSEEESKMMRLAALKIRKKVNNLKIKSYHTDYMWHTMLETKNEDDTLRVGIELGKLGFF